MTTIYEGTLRESGNSNQINRLLQGMGLGAGATGSVASLTTPQTAGTGFARGGVRGLGGGGMGNAGQRPPTNSGRRGPTWGVWDGGWEDLVTVAVLIATAMVILPKARKLVGI